MSVVKEGLLYSKSHEWVETLPDGTVKIGISDYAQDSLGDIVFVDMHPGRRGSRSGRRVSRCRIRQSRQ